MTEKHKALMAQKCSSKPDIALPDFPLTSPGNKDIQTEEIGSHTVTPLPNATKMDEEVPNDTNAPIVSPNPAEPSKICKQPSKQALALHRKWQEAAEAMGGPGTRIVVSKPAAKKIIFDFLYDSFHPMNITDIYKVWKSCNACFTTFILVYQILSL